MQGEGKETRTHTNIKLAVEVLLCRKQAGKCDGDWLGWAEILWMGWSGKASLRRETIRQTPDICVKLQGKSIAGGGTSKYKGPGVTSERNPSWVEDSE